jgi:hypothetical protein
MVVSMTVFLNYTGLSIIVSLAPVRACVFNTLL